jgi:hypothetical protein
MTIINLKILTKEGMEVSRQLVEMKINRSCRMRIKSPIKKYNLKKEKRMAWKWVKTNRSKWTIKTMSGRRREI